MMHGNMNIKFVLKNDVSAVYRLLRKGALGRLVEKVG
jgi:hypothetical protein